MWLTFVAYFLQEIFRLLLTSQCRLLVLFLVIQICMFMLFLWREIFIISNILLEWLLEVGKLDINLLIRGWNLGYAIEFLKIKNIKLETTSVALNDSQPRNNQNNLILSYLHLSELTFEMLKRLRAKCNPI